MNDVPVPFYDSHLWPIPVDQLVREINRRIIIAVSHKGYSNLSISQLLALYRFQNGMTLTDLVRKTGKSKQTVSLLIKHLCSQNYLKGQLNEEDHRSTQFFLTEQGYLVQTVVATWCSQFHGLLKTHLDEPTLHLLKQKIPVLITLLRQV